MNNEDRNKIRNEFVDPMLNAEFRIDYVLWLEEQLHTARLAMSQVDDELIVNWIAPPADGNYRKALHRLVCDAIDTTKYFDEQQRLDELKSDEQKRLDALHYSNYPFDQ